MQCRIEVKHLPTQRNRVTDIKSLSLDTLAFFLPPILFNEPWMKERATKTKNNNSLNKGVENAKCLQYNQSSLSVSGFRRNGCTWFFPTAESLRKVESYVHCFCGEGVATCGEFRTPWNDTEYRLPLYRKTIWSNSYVSSFIHSYIDICIPRFAAEDTPISN